MTVSPSLHLTVLIPGQCPSDNPGRAMSGGQGHLVNVAQPFKIKMSFKRSVTVARVKGLLRLRSEEVRKGNRHLQAVVRENTGTPACYTRKRCYALSSLTPVK